MARTHSIKNVAAQVWAVFTPRERRQFMVLAPAVVLVGLCQMAAMASILPFLTLLSDPTTESAGPIVNWLAGFEGFETRKSQMFALGVGALCILTVGNVFSGVTTWVLFRFSWMRNYSLSTRLLASYIGRPYSFFLASNSAELTKSVLAETQAVVSGIITNGMQFFSRLTTAAFTVGLLVLVDPVLALVSAGAVGTIYGGLYATMRNRLSNIGKSKIAADTARYKAASELFGGIKELKVLGIENSLLQRFNAPSLEFSTYMARAAIVAQIPRFALETVAFGSVIIMVLYVLHTGGAVTESMPLLGLYGFASIRLLPAIQTIFAAMATIRFNAAALDAIYTGFQGGQQAAAEAAGEAPSIPEFSEGVSVKGLSFRYPGSEGLVLRDVDLDIRRGEWVAFVGPSGSGKSTLADVLLGLLPQTSGSFCVDGREVSPGNCSQWQRQIGYVPQSIYLTDDTILHNIALGTDRAAIDKQAAMEAAKVAQIHDFISEELPLGYDTVVGERGARLSGGQRQRIGIARALYRNPAFLVLDEATSALDAVTEQCFFDALAKQRGTRTIISIAHRISTTKDCDCVYVLSEGQIIGRGSHRDLLADNKTFLALSGA